MCDNQACSVHTRKDVRTDVTSEFGSGSAITYIGEYCVCTGDNPAFTDPMLPLLALMGSPIPGMFFTFVVKVGDRAVGDLSKEEIQNNVVHQEDFLKLDDDFDLDAPDSTDQMNEMFHEHHDAAVLAVQSGLIA